MIAVAHFLDHDFTIALYEKDWANKLPLEAKRLSKKGRVQVTIFRALPMLSNKIQPEIDNKFLVHV